jgi:hypothetical protein
MSVTTGNKLSKSLPRRASSSHRSHDRRARSYERGQKRKAERIKAQKARELKNKEYRERQKCDPPQIEKWADLKARQELKRQAAANERAGSTWRKLVGPVNKCVRGHKVAAHYVPGKGCIACLHEGYTVTDKKVKV